MMLTVLTSAVLALLPSQTALVKTPVAATVPQWSRYEITLMATGQNKNPYVSVDLLGVFSGPKGEAVVVNGYWDGGRTFRLGFTPTSEGTWTFTTVSDDPGMDAHEGTITCVKTSEDLHGFVRHSADRPAAWRYDDGGAVRSEGSVAVLGRAALCGSAGDPCTENVGLPRDSVDVGRLQAADRLVTEALAAGRVAEIGLFDAGDAGSIDGPQMYRYIEYMTARYAAFPNVVWCMRLTSADKRRLEFWYTARSLTRMLDPYFGRPPLERVLRDECAPAPEH
jgi:hypothetical protein